MKFTTSDSKIWKKIFKESNMSDVVKSVGVSKVTPCSCLAFIAALA